MPARLVRAIAVAALCASALAACGSNPAITQTIKGAKAPNLDPRKVHIYSSLPLHGPLRGQSEAIMRGINLALSAQHHRVVEYQIKYIHENDITKLKDGGWSWEKAADNAQQAASDPQAVFYIGDLDTPATKLSLPILNQAGIVQVTPGSAYVGLTDQFAGVTQPGEPYNYYPNRDSRTLLRMVPSDVVESAAGLHALQTYGGGCKHFAVAAYGPDGDAYPLMRAFQAQAKAYEMTYVPSHKPDGTAASILNYAEAIKHASACSFVLTGRVTPAAVALTREIHAELPTAMILGTAGFCNSAWTGQGRHGPASTIGTLLYCTQAKLPKRFYPGFGEFSKLYRQQYGQKTKPDAYALYGYEAAEMATGAITGLGPNEDDRAVVREALLGGGPRDEAVLEPFSFNANGDTTFRTIGLYRAGSAGNPTFYKAITP
jgi:branched-chain amino acid transport system substrate-binding protein